MEMKSKTMNHHGKESPVSPLLLAILGVSFLFQAYHLRSQPWTLAFMAYSYSNLLLLFWCIETHDKVPEGSQRRELLRIGVWFFSNSLIAVLSYRVAEMMPLAVKVLVWAMAGTAISVTTFGFFCCPRKPEDVVPAARTALEP